MSANEKIHKLEEEKDNLEHELFEGKIKGVRGQVMALGDTLHQRIDNLEEKNEKEFGYIKEGLDEIKTTTKENLKQAKETNGRVTDLEVDSALKEKDTDTLTEKVDQIHKDTRLVRFIHKYPKISVAFVLFAYLFSIKEVRDITLGVLKSFFGLFGKLF